jgi:hypothetical protein
MTTVQIDDYNCEKCNRITLAELNLKTQTYTCLRCLGKIKNGRRKIYGNLALDYAQAFLSDVNWHEIADSINEDLKEIKMEETEETQEEEEEAEEEQQEEEAEESEE